MRLLKTWRYGKKSAKIRLLFVKVEFVEWEPVCNLIRGKKKRTHADSIDGVTRKRHCTYRPSFIY
jgi:hypothetical protein